MGKRLWLLAGAVILASVVAVAGAAAKEAGVSSKAAKTTLVYGAEQDINGFNTNLECCNQFWAVVIGNSPVLRGAFIITDKLQYKPDVVSSTKLTPRPFSVTYNIRKNAKWSDGKPVTGQDFIWSAQKIVDPNSQVAGRDGYDQMNFAKSKDFNKIWANCVCDPKTGKPIGNGPFLLQSYRKGQDATLVRNPRWHGPKAKLQKIIFRFIQDTNTE